MKKSLLSLCLLAATSTAQAGGIDRSQQGLGTLFEKGRHLEISVNRVMPSVKGTDLLGGSTSDVAGDYLLPGLSLKFDVDNRLSLAIVADQTYGADILYGLDSPLLGGTLVDVTATAALGLARYRFNEYLSVHGGLRVQNAHATVRLRGLAYGPVSGYEVRLEPDTASSPVVGIAFENPSIALRLAATYHGATEHMLPTRESAPLVSLNGTSTTSITTPSAINLDFQTGIAEDTLLFAQLRWVDWSAFRVAPERFLAVTGEGLIELKDTRTWTLGLARQFSERWAGAIALNYEGKGDPLSSPLAPVNGRHGLTVAAIYQMDANKITAGLSFIKLGNARPETGTPDVQRATMRGNTAIGLGIKLDRCF